jgi:hypothetical protein
LFAVEMKDPAQLPAINQQRIRAKLLSAHGVSATRNGNNFSILVGTANQTLYLVQRLRLGDSQHVCRIELGMDVVNQNRSRARREIA